MSENGTVLLVGGGPSMKATGWRHYLDKYPSMAINEWAWEAGLKTTYYVQADAPDKPQCNVPIPVLEDPSIAKYLLVDYQHRIKPDWPNLHFFAARPKFDYFCEKIYTEDGKFNAIHHQKNTMGIAVRLLCCLKLRDVYMIGVDLTHPKYARWRRWLKIIIPDLKKHWNMTFKSLNPDNDIADVPTVDRISA